MAQLTLTVIGNVDDVNKKIDAIRTNLQQNPIKIRIDASGADAVTKGLIEYAKWTAKATSAEADLEKQRAKTATATARQAEAEAKAKAQREQTNRAVEATRQAEERTRKQIVETNTERERQIKIERQIELQNAKTATEQARLATQEARTRAETEKLDRAMQDAGNSSKFFGDILHRIEMRAINSAINAVTNSLRDALQTLKDVDDELVTIRKVTGFSGEQIDAIKKQAFEVASAYGETADAYLESVAAFSRAGYKEQSAELAELATKTQIVGDTTAETANQFLLSVDKAYKFQGSIEELSKVLDGANEIDNKYATSIEKIASGMGIVAPVASQMHVQVNELAAAIGTITAVTQRSGTEAARALRALFLNIAGDTKTEIDEGITWTTGEIEGLRDVIKMYAKDAYDAAQATGKIIDPMKAMEGLAKSMAEGVLTEQKLIEMVSDIGGKLRTSQLLAIIQNWDMYQSMLQDYAGAIGSADKEVNNALDSWTRKTNQLKNAWAEFVSHLIDSKEIKAGLDILIGFVNVLDSGVGKVAAFALAVVGITSAITKLIPVVKTLNLAFMSSPLFIAGVAAAALAGIVQLIDNVTHAYDKQKEKLAEVQAEYDKLYGDGGEYDRLKSRVGELTEEEFKRLGVLESQRKELEEQLQKEKEITFETWRRTQNSTKWEVDPYTGVAAYETKINLTEQSLANAQSALARLNNEWTTGLQTSAAYNSGLQKIIISLQSSAEAIKRGKEAGQELTATEKSLLDLYELLTTQVGLYTAGIEKQKNAKTENQDATEELASAENALKTAFEEVENKSSLTYGTLEELEKLYPGLSKKILDANGNLTAEGQAALSTKAGFVELIAQMISFNNSGLDVSGKILALQELEWQALGTGAAVKYAISAADVKSAADAYVEIGYSRDEAEAQVYRDYENSWNQRVLGGLKNQQYIPAVTGGGGGGRSSKTPEELEKEAQQEHLKGLKQVVSDEKAKYELMVAQGKSGAELSAQADLIQQKLHDQAEYMREIEEPYASVAALSKEWWDWEEKKKKVIEDEAEAAEKAAEEEKKRLDDAEKAELQSYKDKVDHWKTELSFLEASGASDEDRIKAMKEIQWALHQQAEYMRSIKADEDDIRALSTEWWTIQNKINDILGETAETLKKEISETIENIIGQLEEQSNNQIEALQAEIDLLKEQHDLAEDTREEEEKRLAIEKARIALENAQRERTVRQYNAATGQWEWVANAKNVQAAQEELAKSEAALSDYLAEQEYKKKIAELEAQKEESKSVFQTVKDAMNSFAEAVAKILESPKLDANAKKKFVSDIEAILTAPILDANVKPDFIKGVTDVLTAPDLDDSVKTEFISDIQYILTSPELPDNIKEKFVNDITRILTAPGLTDKAKDALVKDLTALINNKNIRTDVQTKIVSAIAELVGSRKDADSAVGLFRQFIVTAIQNAENPESAINTLCDRILSGAGQFDNIDTLLQDVNNETNRLLLIAKMKANSEEWFTAGAERRAELHNENVKIGTALGWDYESSTGLWYTDKSRKQVAYTPSKSSSNTTDLKTLFEELGTTLAEAIENIEIKVNVSVSGSGSSSSSSSSSSSGKSTASTVVTNTVTDKSTGNVHTVQTTAPAGKESSTVVSSYTKNGFIYKKFADGTIHAYNQKTGVQIYDTGGILHGVGNIKATSQDEMVLPPDMTRKLLTAEANGAFDALLSHLGIVTAAANSYNSISAGRSSQSIGSQHNGDVYEIGGVTLSESKAKSMTVYELAQMGRALALHTGS